MGEQGQLFADRPAWDDDADQDVPADGYACLPGPDVAAMCRAASEATGEPVAADGLREAVEAMADRIRALEKRMGMVGRAA